MKKLTVLLLFTCAVLSAQEYTESILIDMAGVTTDTIIVKSVKPLNKELSRIVEVDFTELDCSLLGLNIGYGVSDEFPTFLDTIPNITLPVTLDKTTYTSTYGGVENNSVSFDIISYSGNYIWFQFIYNAGCTEGEVKLRYKK